MHKDSDIIKAGTPEDRLAHNIIAIINKQERFEFSNPRLTAAIVHETIGQLMAMGVFGSTGNMG